jgi:hypothetical protein
VTAIVSIDAKDGLRFDAASIAAQEIREEHDYDGVRVTAYPAHVPITVRMDIGFGDAVTPPATALPFPTLLGHDPPVIRAYPPETAVAEKVEAICTLGIINSRMKDRGDSGNGFSDGARGSRMAYPRGCRRSSRKTPGSNDSGSATLAARSSIRCRGHSPTRSRSSGDSSSQLWRLHQASDRHQIDGGHQRAGGSTDVQTSAHHRTKRQNPRPPLGLPRVLRESRQLSKRV